MELSSMLIFKIAAFLIAILLAIGLFAQLSWLTKARLSATLLLGIILIGILAWPLAAPSEPLGAVYFETITGSSAVTLVGLAFLTGFAAYFLSWPYGREIGILAVPAGLAAWALCTGSISDLIKQNPALEERQALFAALKWEPFFWVGVVAAGFAGVLLGQRIRPTAAPSEKKEKPNPERNLYLNALFAIVGSVLIAQICIKLFAQEVKILDRALGLVVAQPAVGQIAFGVCVSFGIAAFVVKKFLDAGYIWPTIASALLTAVAVTIYAKPGTLQHLVQRWPAVFFTNATLSILPVQVVAFGTLGSVAGYWLAVQYDYWREHA